MTSHLRPLGISFLAFLAGLLLALRFSPDPLPLVALGLTGSLASLALHPRSRGSFPTVLLLAAFAAAGGSLGALSARASGADCRAGIADGARILAEGVLGAGIRPGARVADSREPLLPLAHTTLRVRGGTADCEGAVRVRLPESAPAAAAGSRIRVTGEWAEQAGPVVASRWPAEPYYSGFVLADSIEDLSAPSLRTHPLLALRGRTEARLWALFPRHGPLVEALLLGRRERLDPALTERFARSGLVHLLAISGSHVGLFASIVLIVGSIARVPRQRLAWLCIALVAGYLAMIGAPAAAVRAGIMLTLALLAGLLQRPAATAPVLATAALLILALEPRTALDVGFQLSFAGVLGIVAAHRARARWAPGAGIRSPPVRYLRESLLASLGAFLATAPISAHHFGQVAPVAIAANVPAVPLTGLALSGVVGALALAPLGSLAALVADGAAVALAALDRVAEAAADIPYGHFPVRRPAWWAWAAGGLGLALALAGTRRLRPAVRGVVAGGSCAALLLAWPVIAQSRAGGALEVHFLDVGQGDAVALRTPADRWLLVDAGGRGPRYDAGERRVLPFLRAYRVARLEALVLTHPDADHIGGAPAVLRDIPVGRIIEPGLPVAKDLYGEVLHEVDTRGIPWSAARSGRTFRLDGVELRFLWPDPELLDHATEANEISAVLRVSYGGFALLLTGDAPEAVERVLVARDSLLLHARVLKAGHHGSTTSTSAALLRAARPELVVISAGRRNRYGHPAPTVLERIRRLGIDIARTDREGTVSLRATGDPHGTWTRIDR